VGGGPGVLEIRKGIAGEIQETELAVLQKAVSQDVEPTCQGGHLKTTRLNHETMMDVSTDREVPVDFALAKEPLAGPGLYQGGLVPGGRPALPAEPGTQGEKDFRVEGFGENNPGSRTYHSPERVVGPIEFQKTVAMDQQEAAIAETHDFCFGQGIAAVPLVHETRSPDIMVAPDEMDFGSGIPDPVQALQNRIVSFEAEVGVIEPEIENVSQQDEVVGPGCEFEKLQEPGHAGLFGLTGNQMKMGIGHDNGGGLF